MKVLFDQGVPVPLRKYIPLEVCTCYEMDWATMSNGELVKRAERSFDLFVTTDKNLRYQQDLSDRKIAILVLPTTRWPLLKQHTAELRQAILDMQPSAYSEWALPSV